MLMFGHGRHIYTQGLVTASEKLQSADTAEAAEDVPIKDGLGGRRRTAINAVPRRRKK